MTKSQCCARVGADWRRRAARESCIAHQRSYGLRSARCRARAGRDGRIDASAAIVQRSLGAFAGRQGFHDWRGNAGGPARQIARALGGSPVRISGSKKSLYHTAAAMAAGHVLEVEEAATQ